MKQLNQLFTLLFTILCFSNTYSQNYSGPESVDYYPANNCYYISNTSSSQILKRSPNGSLSVFVAPPNAPYGLEIVDSILYACVGGGIRAYNLNTGSQVFNQSLGATFLNGITHDNNGNLYITDFSAKKVYRMNRFTQKYNVFVNNTVDTPNGIIYDSYDGITPRLVYACWNANAKVKAINLADSTQSTLVTTSLTSIDGIAKGNGGFFYLASWTPDAITRYDSTFSTSSVVVSGLSNPADIYYNLLTDTLAVPNAGNNTVTFHSFLVTGKQELTAPSENQLYVSGSSLIFRESPENNLQLDIFAADGKQIHSTPVNAGVKRIELPVMPEGIYMFRTIDSKGQNHNQKIFFQP